MLLLPSDKGLVSSMMVNPSVSYLSCYGHQVSCEHCPQLCSCCSWKTGGCMVRGRCLTPCCSCCGYMWSRCSQSPPDQRRSAAELAAHPPALLHHSTMSTQPTQAAQFELARHLMHEANPAALLHHSLIDPADAVSLKLSLHRRSICSSLLRRSIHCKTSNRSSSHHWAGGELQLKHGLTGILLHAARPRALLHHFIWSTHETEAAAIKLHVNRSNPNAS